MTEARGTAATGDPDYPWRAEIEVAGPTADLALGRKDRR
jgi:hypothetical protein